MLVVIAALLLWPARPAAHDIPRDVLIQMFVKPEGSRLRLLLRVPLAAMRDVDFPLVGVGFLDLGRADFALRTGAKTWIADSIALYENRVRLAAPRLLAAHVSLPADRSFGTYDEALAHVTGPPLAADTQIIWNQALFDVLYEYDIASEHSDFSIDTDLVRLGNRVVTVMRFLPPDGSVRAFEYLGDPGPVRLDPRWHQAAWRFVVLGFEHILDGIDHLLFVFCLVIPFRRFGQLVIIVTAFTIAHSITLMLSALSLGPSALWFPPLIETLIAVSILYMALENIFISSPGAPGTPLAPSRSSALQRRWMVAFAFGLVHGFGFSFALGETLQFAGSHLVMSLVSFNIGVELGQILVLAILVPALQLLFRYGVAERMGTIILSAFVAHTAWHWVVERVEALRQYSWPALDAATLARALRWTIAALVIVALVRLIRGRASFPQKTDV